MASVHGLSPELCKIRGSWLSTKTAASEDPGISAFYCDCGAVSSHLDVTMVMDCNREQRANSHLCCSGQGISSEQQKEARVTLDIKFSNQECVYLRAQKHPRCPPACGGWDLMITSTDSLTESWKYRLTSRTENDLGSMTPAKPLVPSDSGARQSIDRMFITGSIQASHSRELAGENAQKPTEYRKGFYQWVK